MNLKLCPCCAVQQTTKNAIFIGRSDLGRGLLMFNCQSCKSTFAISSRKGNSMTSPRDLEFYEQGVKDLTVKIETLEMKQQEVSVLEEKKSLGCQINNLKQTRIFYEHFVKQLKGGPDECST